MENPMEWASYSSTMGPITMALSIRGSCMGKADLSPAPNWFTKARSVIMWPRGEAYAITMLLTTSTTENG